MTDLELAALSYVAAREVFDRARYAGQDRRRYELAWRRLKNAARAVAVEAEKLP